MFWRPCTIGRPAYPSPSGLPRCRRLRPGLPICGRDAVIPDSPRGVRICCSCWWRKSHPWLANSPHNQPLAFLTLCCNVAFAQLCAADEVHETGTRIPRWTRRGRIVLAPSLRRHLSVSVSTRHTNSQSQRVNPLKTKVESLFYSPQKRVVQGCEIACKQAFRSSRR
jgi:hypothetical protein